MKKKTNRREVAAVAARGSTQNFTQELNREIFFTLYLHITLRTSSLPDYLSKPQAH